LLYLKGEVNEMLEATVRIEMKFSEEWFLEGLRETVVDPGGAQYLRLMRDFERQILTSGQLACELRLFIEATVSRRIKVTQSL
jgi:hypothetical protein